MDNYPFYTMEGRSLHEVNVGPIHAGIIEPGAFRFICNGEQVLHLEIALGYQHRGVEHEFETTANRLRRMCLAEAVAGDSAVTPRRHVRVRRSRNSRAASPPHGSASNAPWRSNWNGWRCRSPDTGALCMDVGYQLGQVACEAAPDNDDQHHAGVVRQPASARG